MYNMLNDMHNHWKHAEAVRIKCMDMPTVDMKNICTQLEIKTSGKIIQRHGGLLVLYRGMNYKPKKQLVIPLMLWKPQEPVYLRLIKTIIDGLPINETRQMRKSKKKYYGTLVSMVRDAFLTKELGDYKKIGCKLRDGWRLWIPVLVYMFARSRLMREVLTFLSLMLLRLLLLFVMFQLFFFPELWMLKDAFIGKGVFTDAGFSSLYPGDICKGADCHVEGKDYNPLGMDFWLPTEKCLIIHMMTWFSW